MNGESIKTRTILAVFFLFVVAFSIRFFKVDTAPSGILVDEASFGYNAYSILKTGKDEFGKAFPLVFKAFGDQKLPLYAYLIVPFIKGFGLSTLAVRLPSVLAGSFLAVVIYFLLLELGFNKKVGYFGGVITAISPWTIMLSRFGYESNVGLLCFALGILFSFISLRKKHTYVPIVAGIFFALTFYSYIAYRVITPLVLLSFFFVKDSKGSLNARQKIIAVITFVLITLPLFTIIFNPQSSARFNQTGYGYTSGLKMEIDENRNYCAKQLPQIVCYISSNKALFNARAYLYRYIATFSPGYLFMTGDTNEISLNMDNFGLFYVWLLPFYIAGLVAMANRLIQKRLNIYDAFVFIGLLVAAAPAILVGSPHNLRLSALFPFLIIVISQGVALLDGLCKSALAKRQLFTLIYALSIASVSLYLVLYLAVHIQKYEAVYRTYVPKLMEYLGKQGKDNQIYIKSISEGIIYYAFVNKIDPKTYQANVIRNKPDSIGFAHSSDLLNVHITDNDFLRFACAPERMNQKNVLYVSGENRTEIPDNAKKIIYSENGVDSLGVVYEMNKIDSGNLPCTTLN